MKLRYLGATETTFPVLRLSVEPGQEFDAPDDQAPGLLVRSDVELVQDPPRATRAKSDKPKADETAATN